MIETEQFEDVTCIRMSREVEGRALYWTGAYLVDGLLIDTGCSYTAGELVAFLQGKKLELVVNTHFHEDHVGADRLIKETYGVDILAHPDSVPRIDEVPELRPYQEFVWGYPDPVEVGTLGGVVETGKYRFNILETGGHSAGHVALVERERGWCAARLRRLPGGAGRRSEGAQRAGSWHRADMRAPLRRGELARRADRRALLLG